jgi:hypothetical protein
VSACVQNEIDSARRPPAPTASPAYQVCAFIRRNNAHRQSAQLLAVLVHEGVPTGGHYYSFVRLGDRWHKFNDAHVSEVAWTDVTAASFGGALPTQAAAYALVFVSTEVHMCDGGASCGNVCDVQYATAAASLTEEAIAEHNWCVRVCVCVSVCV